MTYEDDIAALEDPAFNSIAESDSMNRANAALRSLGPAVAAKAEQNEIGNLQQEIDALTVVLTAVHPFPQYLYWISQVAPGGPLSRPRPPESVVADGDACFAIYDNIGGHNEQQSVTQTGATAGTLTLTYDEQPTAGIAYNATAATVQAAVEALANIGAGNVVCTGGPLGSAAVVVEFQGALAKADVAQMTTDSTGLTGGTASVATIRNGFNPSALPNDTAINRDPENNPWL